MHEPEEEPHCECVYVEALDAMNRDNCPFHSDLVDQADAEACLDERKQPRTVPGTNQEADAA
jgi:hypothetical protein